MIAKITAGVNAEGLARYLHGPGKSTRHTIPGTNEPGGMVVARSGTIAAIRVGSTEWRGWARRLQQQANLRPKSKGTIWHCSLNLAPTDPRLSPDQWRSVATMFMDQMGASDRSWVAVQHDDRGIHIVMARPQQGESRMWSRHNERYRAQAARQVIEDEFDLEKVRTRKEDRSTSTEVELQRIEYELTTAAMLADNGIHEVEAEGRQWQVRRLDDGRTSVWRRGLDGAWSLLKKGMRTLAQALLRDRKAAEASKVREIRDHLAGDHLAGEISAPPPPGQAGRGPGR
jgi:hypothetical protein